MCSPGLCSDAQRDRLNMPPWSWRWPRTAKIEDQREDKGERTKYCKVAGLPLRQGSAEKGARPHCGWSWISWSQTFRVWCPLYWQVDFTAANVNSDTTLYLIREFFVGIGRSTNTEGALAVAATWPEYPCIPVKVLTSDPIIRSSAQPTQKVWVSNNNFPAWGTQVIGGARLLGWSGHPQRRQWAALPEPG